MTEQELEEIEARANAGTPGPWEETWRDIDVYDHGYQVSDFGNVRSLLNRGNNKQKLGSSYRLLKLVDDGRGYKSVQLPLAGTYKRVSVHRLVAKTFIGICPEGEEVAHIDGNPSNNRVSNLKYCSHRENESHKLAHGTAGIGEQNSMATLQGWQVAEIKYLADKSIEHGKIAALFGITYKQVSAILSETNWSHVSPREDIPKLIEEIRRMNKVMEECERLSYNAEDHMRVVERMNGYGQDNERLRALIKKAERSGACLDECPWCGFAGDGHDEVCEAFTGSGEVK